MRATTFVILCCALQYVTADAIDDALSNAVRQGRLETKKVNETDEIDYDPLGQMYEKSTTTKEYEAFGDIDQNVTGDDVKVTTIVIKKDASGHETIWEEDVLIKKKGQAGSSAETETRTVLSSKPRGPLNAPSPAVIIENNRQPQASSASSSSSVVSSGPAYVPSENYLPYGKKENVVIINNESRPASSASAASTASGSQGGLGSGYGSGAYGPGFNGLGGLAGEGAIVINNNRGSGSSSSSASAAASSSPAGGSLLPVYQPRAPVVIINNEESDSSSASASASAGPTDLVPYSYAPYARQEPQIVIINEENASGASASASASAAPAQPFEVPPYPYVSQGPQVVVINEGVSGAGSSASASSSGGSYGLGRGRARQSCKLLRRQFLIRVGRKGACATC